MFFFVFKINILPLHLCLGDSNEVNFDQRTVKNAKK
jgi:hypothetical protein